MTDSVWQLLTTAPNAPTARALVTLLEGQGVECQVRTDSAIFGEAMSCAVMVEASALDRAKRVLSEACFTDAELEFLATGAHCCDDAKEKQ